LCPGDVESVDITAIRAHIHHMMSSSRGEFLSSGDAPAITVRGLRVIRGKAEVIHDLSVTIARGTITGLLGPSGCGKTTLMRSVVGTQIVAAGSIDVLGHPAGSPALRHRVGYVTQNPTVYDDLRVILWDRFNALAGRGTTLLVSSHVMDEADHCRDLLLMRDGHLLAHTTPNRLREDTRCNSLEEAFLSIIRHSTAAS
jgi:ABC-type multidrug transport system ATPase subunit